MMSNGYKDHIAFVTNDDVVCFINAILGHVTLERLIFLAYFLYTRKRVYEDVRAYVRKIRFWWVKREIESLCRTRIPVIEKIVYDALRLNKFNEATTATTSTTNLAARNTESY